MSYKITIHKIEEKKTVRRGDHTIIKEEPWTREELLNKACFQGEEAFVKTNPVKRVYGYAPAFETVELVETKIFEQVVGELLIPQVIQAINQL